MKQIFGEKKGRRIAHWIFLLCLTVFTFVVPLHRSISLRYIYDLPVEELSAYLEEASISGVDREMEGDYASHIHLTGAYRVGTLTLEAPRMYVAEVKPVYGRCKLVIISEEDGIVRVLEPAGEPETFALEVGPYKVYYVGRFFFGEVSLTAAA